VITEYFLKVHNSAVDQYAYNILRETLVLWNRAKENLSLIYSTLNVAAQTIIVAGNSRIILSEETRDNFTSWSA